MADTKPKAEAKPKTEDKKPTTPREDPIARQQRLLQETIEKQKAKAEVELVKAREDLEKSETNVANAVRVRDARKARVERLEQHAAGNAAQSYAAALSNGEPVNDGEVDLSEGQVEDA
jgi:hypothetical protein